VGVNGIGSDIHSTDWFCNGNLMLGLPNFCDNIADAFMLVDKMREKGYRYFVMSFFDKECDISFSKSWGYLGPNIAAKATAPTPSLAIVLAIEKTLLNI